MKQFNTISKLLSLMSPRELIAIVVKHNYTAVAHRFKIENLPDFLIAAALEK